MVQLKGIQKQSGHRGQMINQVGLRQQQRHLKEIREKAEQALWFAETYGLTPQSIQFKDTKGDEISLNLNDEQSTTSYENLDEEEKEKVKMILYIMDRFSISLDGYHELTQTQPELPRTHIIESCAKTLDSKWKVTRTPGVAQGTELPLKLLLEEEIRKHLKNKEGGQVETIKIKISGDGTRMSHSSNLFVCSFALVEDGQNCLASSGNHTIAVVKGKEEYDTLKEYLEMSSVMLMH